ncbi:hypothetical protein BofuT4_uP009780.1 [Botrytis cinerea T4]|uniref:Uncharacterized protein n=1 Tax=Botryotinia fuckeliana (strain T4) TaxID=999810 RepID=G2XT16_BOTF4|nr:hypothetical protein BofuT4_uP009780.1 [Botrytis cinerea T4]
MCWNLGIALVSSFEFLQFYLLVALIVFSRPREQHNPVFQFFSSCALGAVVKMASAVEIIRSGDNRFGFPATSGELSEEHHS